MAICWLTKPSSPPGFAADLPLADARFMALSQVPWNSKIVSTPITAAAWKSKPFYGIVATQDRMINPDLERTMYRRANARCPRSRAATPSSSHRLARSNVIEQAARAGR